jgi:hypothetical protein
MDENALAQSIADALADRMGTLSAGRLIGVEDPGHAAAIDLTQQARPWREGDIYEGGALCTYSVARGKHAIAPPHVRPAASEIGFSCAMGCVRFRPIRRTTTRARSA